MMEDSKKTLSRRGFLKTAGATAAVAGLATGGMALKPWSAEAAALHPVGRASAVEIDFLVAGVFAHAGAGREVGRRAAPELQRHRGFGGVVAQEAVGVAMQQRKGGDHFRV